MTFAQIPQDAILELKGLRFHLFAIVQLEMFKGGGVCKLSAKELSDHYPVLGNYDSLCRFRKAMISDGWLIEAVGGLVTRSFNDTDISSVDTDISSVEEEKPLIFNQLNTNGFNNTDEISVNTEKPTDEISVNTDEISGTQIALNRNLISIQETDNKKEEKNAHPHEIQSSEKETLQKNTSDYELFSDGMKLRLKTPKQLPKKEIWDGLFTFWTNNGYSADNLLETFDLLEEIKTMKEAPWHITPKTIEGFIGKIESLRQEAENLLNGETNDTIKPNFTTTNDRRLKDIDETERLIAELLAQGLAESDLQSEFSSSASENPSAIEPLATFG